MDKLINQYSALWTSIAFIVAIGFFILRKNQQFTDYILLFLVIAGIIGIWFVFQPRQSVSSDNADEVRNIIGQGMPVLLEFQSPY